MGSVDIPETRYAKTADGVYLAFQTVGAGPIDIVWMSGQAWNIEIEWEHPLIASFYERLSTIGRLILHDRRGTGLSDRATTLPNLETRTADLLTVMDAVKSEKAVLVGGTEGGALASLVAAGHPDRVAALVWFLATPRSSWAPDYPWGYSIAEQEDEIEAVEHGWGTEAYAASFLASEAPSLTGDHSTERFLARLQRHSVTPGSSAERERMWFATDVRGVLPSISVPTLVIDRASQVPDEGAYAASLIPGAERVLLQGDDVMPWAGDSDSVIAAISRFLGVKRTSSALDRVLATVLFTDIVGSTEKAAGLGDAAWKELLASHDERAKTEISGLRGNYIHTTGDGLLATFDGPARAVRCAHAITESMRAIGLEIRAGCHTGEIELVGNDVQGIAVHIGARVGALAGPSEVLVSSTVKDLVAGSGLSFEDAGEHELKGVPDRWHLYRVVEK
jgi:class 3 adenylate cyclase